MQGDRRRGIRKPNAQQSLLEGAAIARREERRRRAGLAQQGEDAQQQPAGESGGGATQGSSVAWVGCQWLMEGYCGRVEETQVPRSEPAPQEQGDGQDGQMNGDTDPPQRPNRAA